MRYLIFLIFLISTNFIFSQEKTPYFQQEVNYEIHVKLNDFTNELDASENIIYKNNSPKTLSYIYFHLWPNAYKKYNTALGKQKLEDGDTKFYFADESDLGYIDQINFTSNGEKLKWDYTPDNEDICIVYLSKPLLPGEKVNISTPFHVKIPKGVFSRLGHMGQAYQITQWYPKPAVLDNEGWHPIPFLDQGEFYSEFGTYDVYITLPKNYVVGATGDLVNGEKELDWLNKNAEKTAKLDTFDLSDLSFPPSNDTSKTLHYHQEKVHDFGWFADKRYHVLKGEVALPHSKRKVTTWTMFTNNEADLWKKSLEYMHDAIYYYSLWNGDYPYNQVTAVDGALSAGGGMEYPNVTVIGESGNAFTLETTIMHEVGHNWFYGILGSNERDHAWMDEGINSFYESRYIKAKYPSRRLLGDSSSLAHSPLKMFDITQYKHKASYELAYLVNASRNLDQPIELPAADYTSLNYGGIVYAKTSIVFDYLQAYLGNDVFDKCMQKYFETWKFKHPNPKDIREIFEEETGKDLSWFFDDLIKTTKKVDYKIIKAKKDTTNPDNVLIKIKNKGKINGPFSISGIKNGEIVSTQWFEPFDKKEFVSFKKGDFDNYRIDAQLNIPEINRKNNTLKTKGLFKTLEPLRLQWLASIENPDKTQLFFTPIVGFNNNDKAMVGMAFYNNTIPFKKLEYVIAPMYGFGSQNITGYFSTFYHIMPNTFFQDIAVGGNLSSFSYTRFQPLENIGNYSFAYYKIAPEINITFRKKKARQFTQKYFKYRYLQIIEESPIYKIDTLGNNQFSTKNTNYYVNDFSLGIKSKHPINPFSAEVNIQQSKNFVRLNLTATYRFTYKKPKTGFDIRFFVGRFLYNKDVNLNSRFNFGLSGNSDYTYDQIYLDRSSTSGIFYNQIALTDGGFKNLAVATSQNNVVIGNRWLNSINLKSNIFTSYLSFYVDAGIVGSTTKDYQGNEIDLVSDVAYNTGIALNIVPNIFEIYFPIKSSSEFNQLNYGQKIRFTLNLNLLNPFKIARNFDL